MTTEIGAKVAHVRRAGQTRGHRCHWPGCEAQDAGCRVPEPAEFYRIRNRGEWADICIHEPSGTFMAHSSFGTFAHCWSHHGRASLKAFLAGVGADYFFDKTAATYGRVFSNSRTRDRIREIVLGARRRREIDRPTARRCWQRVGDMHARNGFEYFYALTAAGDDLAQLLGDDWDGLARHEPDPQCRGFWELIWPGFLAAIRAPAPARHQEMADG